jgi:quercetin dioxygenase-like cupin family protein
MTIRVVDHAAQELARWRPGNLTRMNIGAANGAEKLCLVEQWFEPGTGAPTHVHPGVEETITVLRGTARCWIDDEEAIVREQMTIILPADCRHGFTNVGDDELHIFAAYSSASVPTEYEEARATTFEIGGKDGTRVDAARTQR